MKQGDEIYHWMNVVIDIETALKDFRDGKVKPEEMELDAAFVNSYAQQILRLNREEGENQTHFGIFGSVNAKAALSLPETVLDMPVFLMHVGAGKGLLSLSPGEQASYVLADGNHRLARAFFDNRTSPLKAVKFSPDQSRTYFD